METPRADGRQQGAGLLIILLIIMSIASAALVAHLNTGGRALYSEGDPTTESALTQAKEALLGYAITYRDQHADEVPGYLPCPDFDGDGDADTGVAGSGCSGSIDGIAAIGLLPYKTLGLPDLRDREGNCLWYAVSGSFKADLNKPTPMNWDTQGQFRILDAGGSTLIAPDDANGGAAAVVFGPGAPLSGQSRSTSTFRCATTPSPHSAFLDGNYDFATTATIALTAGPVGTSPNDITNNDRLVWLTPKEILDRISGRSDFPTKLNSQISNIKAALVSPLPPPTGANNNQLPTSVTGLNTSDANFYKNWRDQFRYRACPSPNSYCYTIAGTACDGALLFGGKADAAANDATTPRASGKRNDVNHIETTGGVLDFVAGSSTTITSLASAYAATSPAVDVGFCLLPQPPYPPYTPFSLTGLGTFATATASPLAAGLSSSGSLGTLVAPSANASGCAWHADAVDFAGGIRVYFRMAIVARDSGITFALADATANPTTAGLCGDGGAYLGYAGLDSVYGGSIAPPKIALELDTRRDALTAQPDVDLAPTTVFRHVAFAYWGALGDPSSVDDNTHGAGTGGSTTAPRNPSVADPGLTGQSFVTTATVPYYHVRLDMTRSHDAFAATASFQMKAYVLESNTTSWPACSTILPDLSNDVSVLDTASLCPNAKVSDSISIADSMTTPAEAMKRVFLGFTVGQRATRTQRIDITDFRAANHP